MTYNLAGDGVRPWYDLADVPPVYSHPTTLLVPTADLSAELIDQLNQFLDFAGSAWKVKSQDSGIHSVVTPLIPVRPPGPPASGRPDPVRDPADIAAVIRAYGGDAVPDLIARSAPAGKPDAVTRGDLGRVPVTSFALAPAVRDPATLPGGRRPVVALLDNAIDSRAGTLGATPWLGDPDPNGVWVDADTYGWEWTPDLQRPPDPAHFPLLASHTGHATFSAGLIRQVAPDARILSVRVMADDGEVWADALLNAFGWLYEKARSSPGFVDVICCPITLDAVLPRDEVLLRWLRTIIGALGGLGVRVVVAAGNTGRTEPTFPGAFSASSSKSLPRAPLVAVGALNPNGTKAYYSADGDWIGAWEYGTSVVSLFPHTNANGDGNPELGPKSGFESLDPDHFTGWARWSGTSFAAAIHAGKLARQWTDGPE